MNTNGGVEIELIDEMSSEFGDGEGDKDKGMWILEKRLYCLLTSCTTSEQWGYHILNKIRF